MISSRLIEKLNFNLASQSFLCMKEVAGIGNGDAPNSISGSNGIINLGKFCRHEVLLMNREIATTNNSRFVGNLMNRVCNSTVVRFLTGKFPKSFKEAGNVHTHPRIDNFEASNHSAVTISESVLKICSRRVLKVLLGVSVLGIAVTMNTLVVQDASAQAPHQMRIGWLDDNGTQLTDYKPGTNRYDNVDYQVGIEKHLEYVGADLPVVEGLTSIWNIDTTFSQEYWGTERIYDAPNGTNNNPDLFHADLWDVGFTGGRLVNTQVSTTPGSRDAKTLHQAATLPNPFDFSNSNGGGNIVDSNPRYYTIGENFKYGTWYIQFARYNNCGTLFTAGDGWCRQVFFDPNEEEIAKLKTNQVVRSRLYVDYGDDEHVNQQIRHFIIRLTRNHRSVSARNPRLFITAESSTPYRVGSTATFTVTASDGDNNIAPSTPLTVNYKIDSSDYISDNVENWRKIGTGVLKLDQSMKLVLCI